ncbi:MAG: ATP-dependent Clp protease ATP-binding subunit ClpX [bacterium]|nr:ATP-dependent Clp protease ATP-binding subunit ClpX [bacterium]
MEDVTGDVVDTPDDTKEEETEKKKTEVCYICGRTEKLAGPLMHIPNNITICKDCMQKTFDSMNQFGFPMGNMNTEETKTQNNPFGGIPGISMINLADLAGMMPGAQRIKKKKPKEKKKVEPVLDIHSIPAPHKIKATLDEHVVGQEHAKKVMSVAVYNHYKRIFSEDEKNTDGVEIEKSNMLMVGPTGCGKTYLVKTLARLLDVPLAITDATSLTEAGYIGDDIESVVSKLLAAADNDVERAEHGIIFIDEIDKIAKKKNTNQRDVSGESVQQGMLKLLEGAQIEVPVGASSKNAMVPMATVDTKNILFICGGAFPDLDEIIKERLNKNSSMGFQADLKDKYDKEENLLKYVTVEDIRKFGMIPEFIGRLPILFSLDALDRQMLVRILTEPKNAIIKQYQKLLSYDEVALEFEEDALLAIADRAKEKKVGARALRAIIEEFMLDIMYEIPKDDTIGKVIITKDYIENHGAPQIVLRGVEQNKIEAKE